MRVMYFLMACSLALNTSVFSTETEEFRAGPNGLSLLELLDRNYKFVKMNPGKFRMGANNGDGFKPQSCLRDAHSAGAGKHNSEGCPDYDHFINSAHPQHEVEITQAFEIADAPLGPEIVEQIIKHQHPGYLPENIQCQSITFNEALRIAQVLSTLDPKYNYRLPTEAEWEYSARCETTDDRVTTTYDGSFPPFSFHELKGVNFVCSPAPAYYGWNEYVVLGPFGRRSDSMFQGPKNWYSGGSLRLRVKAPWDRPNTGEGIQNNCGFKGLRAGNALQWTSDWFDKDYYKTNTDWKDPKGPRTGRTRVLRGGYIDRFEYFAYASMASWARFNPERLGCRQTDKVRKANHFPTKPIGVPCQDEEGISSVTALVRLVRFAK